MPKLQARGRGGGDRWYPVAEPSESGSRVPGEIRVDGLLRLAPDTLYESDVHARGGLVAKPGSIVAGDVYTDGPVELAPTARIGGRIRPTGTGPEPSTGEAGALDGLCREADPDEGRLEAALTRVGEELLDEPPAGAWSPLEVREALFARALGRLAPVTIEREAQGTYLLRLRPGGSGETREDGRLAALARLAARLGRLARPSLRFHELASARTPGDAVLLVEDEADGCPTEEL